MLLLRKMKIVMPSLLQEISPMTGMAVMGETLMRMVMSLSSMEQKRMRKI